MTKTTLQAAPLAVITGGSQGIGLALVKKFLAEGFRVASVSRHPERTPQDISAEERFLPIAADLSSREGCRQAGLALTAMGPATVLVNNAGTYLPGNIQGEAEGTLETLLATNVHSAYHITRAVLPAMLASGRQGHIFNMCSVASITAYTNGGSYCISKFALLGMSKVLREELKGTQIKVTSVLPGATLTPSWEGAGFPSDRFIPADDLALLLYATYVTAPSTVVEELLVRPLLGDL